jgi:hypothetical protein
MISLTFSRALKLAFGLGLSAFLVSAQTCDRACLKGWMTRYLDAVVAHNPAAVPLAANVRFTEDSKDLKVGEGLWKTATKVGTYRQDFVDLRQQVIATHVLVEEGGKTAMVTVRLKVAAGKISEIETLVTHSAAEGRLFALDGLKQPRPGALITPTAAQRTSREEAIKAAMFYPAGLIVGDFVKLDAPFATDAYRLENGVAAAGAGCGRAGCENIKTQTIIKHPDLTSSVAAVDEEEGWVLLWMNFGDTGSYGPGNALVLFEAFKVYGGQIHAVQAFMKVMPKTTERGWK